MIKCQPSLIKNGGEKTIEKLSGKNQENYSQKMKFFIKDFFSKCDQICSFLYIWSHLLKKSMGRFNNYVTPWA